MNTDTSRVHIVASVTSTNKLSFRNNCEYVSFESSAVPWHSFSHNNYENNLIMNIRISKFRALQCVTSGKSAVYQCLSFERRRLLVNKNFIYVCVCFIGLGSTWHEHLWVFIKKNVSLNFLTTYFFGMMLYYWIAETTWQSLYKKLKPYVDEPVGS